MLSKFFKPKWQHTNPVTRLNAVKNLSDEHDDQYLILSDLATRDPDINVRQAAIAQITSVSNLIQLLKTPDADADTIETRLVHKLNNDTNPQILFDRLTKDIEQALMWRIVSQTSYQDLQIVLVNNTDDQNLLLEIATSSVPISTRKTAAGHISHPDLIEQLLKITKQNDKAIYRIMRDKLNEIREKEKQQQGLLEKANVIIEQTNHLSHCEWYPLYPAKLEALNQEWSQLPLATTESYQSQFSDACSTCQNRISAIADVEAAKIQEELDTKLAREQVDTLLQQLQHFITSTENTLFSQQDEQVISLTQEQDNFKNQWESISNTASIGQQDLYNQLNGTLSKISTHARSVEGKLNEIAEFLLLSERSNFKKKPLQEQLKQANKVRTKIAWPTNIERPAPLLQLDVVIEHIINKKQLETIKATELSEKLQTQLTHLDSLIEKGEIKTAEKISRKATEQLSQLKGSSRDAFEQQFKNINTRLDELKDWQGYAVTPKKEQLCSDMENLVSTDIPPQDKAKKIKQLQQHWKLLDATDPFHSQAIWKRFKSASDSAYEPCEAYFSLQNEARRYNLQQKEHIYKEVAAYLQQIDWENCDWRAVEQIIQTAKQEWRRFTPVDRNPGQTLQVKFNELLIDAETRFQNVKEASMATKEKLILNAELLTTADDVIDAAEQAKNLQKDWKECGPTFHSQERKLWKSFRVHCDVIFQRLHDQTPSREAAHAAKVMLNQFTDELLSFEEAPLHTKKKSEHINEARQLIEQFKDTLPVKDIERFNKAARYLEQQTNALKRFLEHADNIQLQEHAFLCEQFETHLLDNSAEKATEEFFASWTLASNNSLHEKIHKRRQQIELVASGDNSLNTLLINADNALREICIRLEIALNISSPDQDQALRMEYQMQRLQKALEQQQQPVNLIDIKKLELEASTIPFSKMNETLSKRFKTLIETVFD